LPNRSPLRVPTDNKGQSIQPFVEALEACTPRAFVEEVGSLVAEPAVQNVFHSVKQSFTQERLLDKVPATGIITPESSK